MESSPPELSVVCKSCGEEVSPYVTECPYCGTRLRKRAPKLERRGDELAPREQRRRRLRRRLRLRLPRLSLAPDRPYATISLILASAGVLLVQRASGLPLTDFGAIVGAVGGEWWRFVAAPFAYSDVGYLFVIAVAIALFGGAVESRLGTLSTLALALACGTLGMLAASGIETGLAEGRTLEAAGGNGIALGLLAAWAAIRIAEVRTSPYEEEVDVIAAVIAAAVLIALPIADQLANVFAGLAGGAVGAAFGLLAAASLRRSSGPA